MKLRLVFFSAFILVSHLSLGQFWFGPKVGLTRTDFNYKNEETVLLLEQVEYVQEDLYRPVKATYKYELGAAMTYTATEKYGVHVELNYERVGKRVRSQEATYFIDNKFTYQYLSVPLFLRVTTQKKPVHFYFNLGPKMSYLLSAKGDISIQLFDEVSPDAKTISYDVIYNFTDRDDPNENQLVLDNPNRFQYSLNIGGGALLDLKTGGRLAFDLRYSWGHSNLGFNRDSELLEFGENVEYSNQTVSMSVGYMFPYNPADQLKGTSTNSLVKSGAGKKKKKKKN